MSDAVKLGAPAVSPDEWQAWRSVFSMQRTLERALERTLQDGADISTPDYEILLALFEAPGRRMRARELGERLDWEKSRVSHQVTRMEKRGLVERTLCDTDGRGTWIGLTPDGSRAVLGAMREHAASMRRYFFDVVTPEELDVMSAASRRVLDTIVPVDCPTGFAADCEDE